MSAPVDVLRKAKVCACCHEIMPAGTSVRWVGDTAMRRDGAGHRHERTIRVPAHTHDCVQAQVDAYRAERAALARIGGGAA